MRYRLIERLGVGGMSEVWRGFDEVLDREVAIKFVLEKTEAVVEARVSHPNIVHVHDYGEWTDGRPFVVMELLEGKTLSAVLNGGFSLPWRQALRICAEIASALAAAHAIGVVHRDVTTGNVMLTPTGARLLDFGIAALAGQLEPARESGDLQGTPAFMAPERLRRGEVTPAADVYALGVLWYRALAGRLPWPAQTQNDLLDAHLWLQPAPLPKIPGLPAGVAELCLRCLAKAPQDRPSAVEIVAKLSPIVNLPAFAPTFLPARHRIDAATVPVMEPTAALVQPQRHRFAVVLGGMAAAILGIFAWGIPGGQKPAAWKTPASSPTTCRVTYQQQQPSTGNSFSAVVTVHNDGETAVSPWQVRFAWPGDQTLLAALGVQAQQQGRDVILHGDRLDPGTEVAVNLTGRYGQVDALPSEFSLAGASCATTILASPPMPPVIEVVKANPAAVVREDAGGHDGEHGGGKHRKNG